MPGKVCERSPHHGWSETGECVWCEPTTAPPRSLADQIRERRYEGVTIRAWSGEVVKALGEGVRFKAAVDKAVGRTWKGGEGIRSISTEEMAKHGEPTRCGGGYAIAPRALVSRDYVLPRAMADELRKNSAVAGSEIVHLHVNTSEISEGLLSRLKALLDKHLPPSEHEADEDPK